MTHYKKTISGIFLTLLSLSVSADKTHWELGAAITAFNTPLYPGSSVNNTFVIPIPYVRIQSDYFEIDDGIRGFLLESPDYRLNISGGFGVPVKSSDIPARNGMEDLNAVLQLGPSLELIFSGGRKKPHEFRLELPLRMAISTDFTSADNAGWIFEPRLSYETLRPFKTGWAYQIRGGLRYGSEKYNGYYYDVPIESQTPNRSTYQSDAGYAGAFVDLMGNWRDSHNIIYFAFLRYQNLSAVAFEDSPLVEQNDAITVGVGLMWVFADNKT